MKKLILIIITIMLSNLAHTQEGSIVVRKWSYELLFAPNISYRILSNGEGEEWYKNDRNNAEASRFGLSVKSRAIYSLGKRWSLGTGLDYSSIGFKIKSTELIWVTPNPDFPTELRSSSRYTYLGLPVLAYYKLTKDKKWNLDLIFGMSINYFLNKNVVTSVKTNGEWTSQSNYGARYDTFNVFGTVGVGTSYRLSKRWTFKTNILLNQSLKASNSLAKTEEYLNFLDINIGINFRIIKTKKTKQ